MKEKSLRESKRPWKDWLDDFNPGHSGLAAFCDGAAEYAYDANGNMTMDANKGISSVLYNSLNLPAQTKMGASGMVTCWYDAAGTLLRRNTVSRTSSTSGGVLPLVGTKEMRCGDFTYQARILGSGMDLKRIEIPGGFIASDTAFWYVTDYQGNVRQVVNGATGAVVQKLDYYPYGTPFGETAVSKISGSAGASNPYKYGAKELLTAGGLNLYDYGARMSDPATGRFTTPDPKEEDYYGVSSYLYCGANPTNLADPTGMDIVVLNKGTGTDQHLAMLIQDEEGKWVYYSINGDNMYVSGIFSGGRPFDDIGIGSWDSPQDFLDSDYNQALGTEGKTDTSVNNYGFAEGFQIPCVSEQDAIMSEAFREISKTDYDPLRNNCATVVQKVMIKGGLTISGTIEPILVPMSTPFGLVDVMTDYRVNASNRINIIPSQAFKAIMNVNPNGILYKKN